MFIPEYDGNKSCQQIFFSTNYCTQILSQCCSYTCPRNYIAFLTYKYIYIHILYICQMLFFWLLREFRCKRKTPETTGDLERLFRSLPSPFRLFRSLPTSPRKDHDEISIYLTRLSLDIDTCLATLWSPGPSGTSKAAALDLQEME